MYILRQFQASLADGERSAMAEATRFTWRLRDILPKYTLSIASGLYSNGYQLVDDTSFAVPLPEDYDTANRLYYALRAEGIVKATVVSPTHGTSTFLIKGTTGTTNGDHHGLLIGVGDITSITLVTSASSVTTPVEWFFFSLPDLTDADSFRLGQLALGVTSA